MEILKYTVLMENESSLENVNAEHGLSLYIEANNYKILFDAGQSSTFLENASKLGIDISKIDFLILSHGHYDHTGGVEEFLKINTKAKVVYKNEIFENKWNAAKYIGVQFKQDILKDRSVIAYNKYEVVPDVFVMTEIPVLYDFDTHFNSLFIKKGIAKKPDTFADELFIVIKKDQKINIITGCAHRGITNIISTALKAFPGMEIESVTGGFHLSKETEMLKEKICTIIDQFKPEIVYPMHCTGVGSMKYLKSVKSRYLHTGDSVRL